MNDGRRSWLEEPRNLDRLFWALCVVCALLVAADLVAPKHPHFSWEGWFGFYALFGFASYAFIVFAGKAVRAALRQEEDYYDR